MSQRRDPSQGRSREMYLRILQSAKDLIVDKGDVEISLREMASHAGIAPSSVYQYFESRDEILLKLVESYFQDTRSYLSSLPLAVNDKEQLIAAISAALKHLHRLYIEEPVLIIIMDRVGRSPALEKMDVSGSKKNSAVVAKQILKVAPHLDVSEVKTVSELLTHLVGWGVRYSASLKGKKKQQAILEHLQSMVVSKIEALVMARNDG